MKKTVYLIGSASGIAAGNKGCQDGPFVLQKSPFMSESGLVLEWGPIIKTDRDVSRDQQQVLVKQHCQTLANLVAEQVRSQQFFTVLGGDHSCAIGTWSGACSAKREQGSLGLIWIDAHMDSHTPETSPSGNIHGMPLACLLGFGDSGLTNLMGMNPKFKPEHVCLIGIRSYEAGEAELLQRLNVRIYYMEEVKERGLKAILTEAHSIVTQGTVGYGLTLDVDSIDPSEAPGTGTDEPDGLSAQELCDSLKIIAEDPRFIGAEIVEFDPHLDQNQLTEKLIPKLLKSLV